MKIIQKILGLGALVSTLAFGCSPRAIDQGEILIKRYEPQREYTITDGIHTPFKRTLIDDEDFIIIFGNNEGREYRTRVVYVTQGVYDSLKVGDNFDTSKTLYEDSDPGIRK